jgi:hypothetical protein
VCVCVCVCDWIWDLFKKTYENGIYFQIQNHIVTENIIVSPLSNLYILELEYVFISFELFNGKKTSLIFT